MLASIEEAQLLRQSISCQHLLEVVGGGGAHVFHAITLGEGREVDAGNVSASRSQPVWRNCRIEQLIYCCQF
jgi:hypothetical protein